MNMHCGTSRPVVLLTILAEAFLWSSLWNLLSLEKILTKLNSHVPELQIS